MGTVSQKRRGGSVELPYNNNNNVQSQKGIKNFQNNFLSFFASKQIRRIAFKYKKYIFYLKFLNI